MPNWKSFLQSRTIWSNGIGLAVLILSGLGFKTAGIDPEPLVDAILQITTGGCFVASTVFRVLATRRLTV